MIYGKTDIHVEYSNEFNCYLNSFTLKALTKLDQDAIKNGFKIKVVSGFRSFEKQLQIWNEKLMGKRKILNSFEQAIDPSVTSTDEKILNILRWSSIPGLSRHHWGSDLDVVDGNALINNNYQIQLTQTETNMGGIFYDFHCWLDEVINQDKAHGFYRPFNRDLNGVAPEKWHLSFRPLAENFSKLITIQKVKEVLTNQDLLHNDFLLNNLDYFYSRFIQPTLIV